ncbi:hypothetical protein B6S12_01840 [Helicobacter valdiviensis]|uniref:Glycosyltransferase 2-like domain-containing protein n=1 Tax=Helicobacter valdiviensis TaxID=1458358 RepID=A0A2W6MWC2_9HELI|nr:glycosyltransferase family 2 protein [Helicobacter valdiviensis]PZT48815.1 hypothetical protein B6S12_01840 [Helicobacter valdiviensis]
MNKPKISVIIPVYNVEKFVSQALESCINQTLRDIEIIVVDDCGNDRSMEIVRGYAKQDERIRIIRNSKNLKPLLSRNIGAITSQADYILFLDADDFLDIGTCEKMYEIIQNGQNDNCENLDIVVFGMYRFFTHSQEVIKYQVYEENKFQSLKDYAEWFYGVKYPWWNLAGRLIKKERYFETLEIIQKDIQVAMAEDGLVSYVLWNCSETFYHTEEILYYYRYNEESSGQTKEINRLRSYLKDYQIVLEEIKRIYIEFNFNKKITKVFLQQLMHEYAKMCHEVKMLSGRLSIMDKFKEYFRKKKFILQRKMRIFLSGI